MSARILRKTQLETLRRLIAAGCVALVLALVFLAASPSAHAWLHHETQVDPGDQCAVVLFSHGVTEAAAAVVLAVVLLFLAERPAAAPAQPDLEAPGHAFPPACGPPAA